MSSRESPEVSRQLQSSKAKMREWVSLVGLLSCVSGFNIDVASRLVHRGTRDTWFGYSVDIYKDAREVW